MTDYLVKSYWTAEIFSLIIQILNDDGMLWWVQKYSNDSKFLLFLFKNFSPNNHIRLQILTFCLIVHI